MQNLTAERRLDAASIEMLQAFSDFGLRFLAEQCRLWRMLAEIKLERKKLEGRE